MTEEGGLRVWRLVISLAVLQVFLIVLHVYLIPFSNHEEAFSNKFRVGEAQQDFASCQPFWIEGAPQPSADPSDKFAGGLMEPGIEIKSCISTYLYFLERRASSAIASASPVSSLGDCGPYIEAFQNYILQEDSGPIGDVNYLKCRYDVWYMVQQ